MTARGGARRVGDEAGEPVGGEWDLATILAPDGVRQLIDGIGAFVAILDPGGIVREVDAKALAVGGLARRDVIGRAFWRTPWWTHDPRVADRVRAAVMAARNGEAQRWDSVVATGDDGRMCVAVRLVPLRSPGGEVAALIASGIDLTPEMHARTAEEEERTRLPAIFDLVPGFLSLHEGPDHVFRLANRYYAAAFGDRPLIGRPLQVAMPEMEGQGLRERFDAVYATGEAIEEAEFRTRLLRPRRDRPTEYVSRLILKPWRDADGRVLGVAAFAIDVSGPVAARDELARTNAILELALDAGRAGVWTADVATGDLDLDASTRELLGLDGGPVTLATLDAMAHPDDLAALQAARARADATGPFEHEYRIAARDGEVWLRVVGSVQMGADGRPVRAVGLNFDISARKRREAQTRNLLREVNHRAKNLLAVVQSVTRHTAASSEPARVGALLARRIAGLACSHDLLAATGWEGVDLGDLARAQIAAAGIAPVTTLGGPDLKLAPDCVQKLGLMIMELALNAVHHGACRDPAGRVALDWSCKAGVVRLHWRETGGPPIEAPSHRGFGRAMTEQMAAHGMRAEVGAKYRPEGLDWALEVAAPDVLTSSPREGSSDDQADHDRG